MSSIHAYLTFNGNCREAMMFYQKCVGGELSFQTIEASPLSGKLPAKMKKYILHATLKNGSLLLMASDMVSEKGFFRGNAISLVLNCASEKETRVCYKNLARGGEQTHPLRKTNWNALFGEVTDKYGNHWLLSYSKTAYAVK
ncbi:MAG TPA: VOC family protein [Agriterribacter sp.]|nr:VOC family protein [Agriterribacter sp.]